MKKSHKPLPQHIVPYAFDFRWDNSLLWKIDDIAVETIHIDELLWHFDIPWLHTPDGRFDLKPKDVLAKPDLYPLEYTRTQKADVKYPIDIMINNGHWLILDGLHRLMKQVEMGATHVHVRKMPRSRVPDIQV